MKKIYPKFKIVLSDDHDTIVFWATKKPLRKSSYILLSLKEHNVNRDSDDCLGKLRSNFVGTKFKIFDTGNNPKNHLISNKPLRN